MAGVPNCEHLPLQITLNHMEPGCRQLEVPIQIKQIELTALLDWDATHNFISSDLIE